MKSKITNFKLIPLIEYIHVYTFSQYLKARKRLNIEIYTHLWRARISNNLTKSMYKRRNQLINLVGLSDRALTFFKRV